MSLATSLNNLGSRIKRYQPTNQTFSSQNVPFEEALAQKRFFMKKRRQPTWGGSLVFIVMGNKKIGLYLAEAVHTITLYWIIAKYLFSNHSPYNSVRTAFNVCSDFDISFS